MPPVAQHAHTKAAHPPHLSSLSLQTPQVLKDLPPRQEEEVDAITLHNSALVQFDEDTSQSFRKLNHLLQNPPYPPEAFQNLLLLCCRPAVARYNLVADMMAENPDMAQSALRADVRQFLQALIARQESREWWQWRLARRVVLCCVGNRR